MSSSRCIILTVFVADLNSAHHFRTLLVWVPGNGFVGAGGVKGALGSMYGSEADLYLRAWNALSMIRKRVLLGHNTIARYVSVTLGIV
jgi:hypothetical protein